MFRLRFTCYNYNVYKFRCECIVWLLITRNWVVCNLWSNFCLLCWLYCLEWLAGFNAPWSFIYRPTITWCLFASPLSFCSRVMGAEALGKENTVEALVSQCCSLPDHYFSLLLLTHTPVYSMMTFWHWLTTDVIPGKEMETWCRC